MGATTFPAVAAAACLTLPRFNLAVFKPGWLPFISVMAALTIIADASMELTFGYGMTCRARLVGNRIMVKADSLPVIRGGVTSLAAVEVDLCMGFGRLRTMAFVARRAGFWVALRASANEYQSVFEACRFPLFGIMASTTIGIISRPGLREACMEILPRRPVAFRTRLIGYALMGEGRFLPIPKGMAGGALRISKFCVNLPAFAAVTPEAPLLTSFIMIGKRDGAGFPFMFSMALQAPIPSLAGVERDDRRFEPLLPLALKLGLCVAAPAHAPFCHRPAKWFVAAEAPRITMLLDNLTRGIELFAKSSAKRQSGGCQQYSGK